MDILNLILQKTADEKKQLAISVDSGKSEREGLIKTAEMADAIGADYLILGGSLLYYEDLTLCIDEIKSCSEVPVIFYPGSSMQIPRNADALLLTSLISGRNPELLIGNFVEAAPLLRDSGLEVIPAGHLLVDSGKITSLMYKSNTLPIPFDKTDIAICTAMAGEMLGLRLIYIDAGAGAIHTVPMEMIRAVRQNISIPLIIGGGIRTPDDALEAWDAGADIIVTSSAPETSPDAIFAMSEAKRDINS